jgi:hypothetical protein
LEFLFEYGILYITVKEMFEDRRKYKRIKVCKLVRIDDAGITKMNICKEGFLLSNAPELLDPGEKIDIRLKVKGKKVDLKSMIMWSVKKGTPQTISMGLLITHAPPEYNEFIENLYLEVDGK